RGLGACSRRSACSQGGGRIASRGRGARLEAGAGEGGETGGGDDRLAGAQTSRSPIRAEAVRRGGGLQDMRRREANLAALLTGPVRLRRRGLPGVCRPRICSPRAHGREEEVMSYRERREAITGPLSVIALGSWYRVLDHGNGSRCLSPKFKTRDAARKWA